MAIITPDNDIEITPTLDSAALAAMSIFDYEQTRNSLQYCYFQDTGMQSKAVLPSENAYQTIQTNADISQVHNRTKIAEVPSNREVRLRIHTPFKAVLILGCIGFTKGDSDLSANKYMELCYQAQGVTSTPNFSRFVKGGLGNGQNVFPFVGCYNGYQSETFEYIDFMPRWYSNTVINTMSILFIVMP